MLQKHLRNRIFKYLVKKFPIKVDKYECNDLQMYLFMGQYLIHHMATAIFSNLLRVDEFKIVSNVYIMGLPHLLKVRWKGKMH